VKSSCVFVALGSNLNLREKNLSAALELLSHNPAISICRMSAVYETAPKYNPGQPKFLNMVVEIATTLTPLQLLEFCKDIEVRLGRHFPHYKNSPREIDLDIIFFNRLIVESPTLTIPHPGLYERKFVLVPLAEIAPEFICPKTAKSVAELLRICPDIEQVVRIGQLDELLTIPVTTGVL